MRDKRRCASEVSREIACSKGPICAARWSGTEQTPEGASGKVRSSLLGTFMAAEARDFSSETVRNMQVALDLAWRSLSPEQQARSSKMEVATRILAAAEAGERSPARLLMLALMSARARFPSATIGLGDSL